MDRPNLDTGLIHRQHEETDALVFRHIPVRPRDQHAVVGGFGERRPHLLPVDHPLVAVALGPGAPPGQLLPPTGLAVEQAPFTLAADRRRNQPALLLVSSDVVQRAGEEVAPVVTGGVRANRRKFSCNEARLSIGDAATIALWFPAGHRPAGVDDDVSPAGPIDIGIPVARQPISYLVAQFVVIHRLRLRSVADSVPGATTGCPAAGRRCGLGADIGAP